MIFLWLPDNLQQISTAYRDYRETHFDDFVSPQLTEPIVKVLAQIRSAGAKFSN